jgi:hypothetical protein
MSKKSNRTETKAREEAAYTVNVITGEDGFVSSTISRRAPSKIETRLADWNSWMRFGDLFVYIVARGAALEEWPLRRLVRSMLEVAGIRDGGDVVTDVVVRKSRKEPPPYTEPPIDFDNDPLWQRIRAISAGGAQ